MITGLDSLQSLNVASNSLGGIIPPDLNFLSSVSMLDLADNHLSGAIPDLSLLPLKVPQRAPAWVYAWWLPSFHHHFLCCW